MIRAKSFSLKQGDHLSFKCEQLLVTAWRAEGKVKMFVMLSSSSSAKMVKVPVMHNTQKMLKPASVDNYNHCRNGMDHSDHFSVSNLFVR